MFFNNFIICLDSYLVTSSKVDGEKVPEEESWHVVQDEAIKRQVERCNSCLLFLEKKVSVRIGLIKSVLFFI